MGGQYLTIIIFAALFNSSLQIYIPNDDINQKPIRYSSGIKTRPDVEFHHNYSRVYHQNGNSNYQEGPSPSESLYPVYNGHSYGQKPSERFGQIYVINGTKVPTNQNPVRRIVSFNKLKRSPIIEVYRACPKNATGQFVYEASCNQFLNCWRGRGYVQNCSPGTLFNPKSLECDFPHKVSCISGPRQTILQGERSARPVRQVGCPRGFSGLIPNYSDCSKFINCVSGIENLMECPNGTLFDIDKNICDFSYKANCFNGENQNLRKQNIDGKLDFGSGHAHQKQGLSYKFGEIKCPDDSNGLFKHPTDCSKFLNCAEGQTHIQDCSPGTLFNPDLKICDYPYNVKCENNPSGSQINVIDYDAGYYNGRNLSRPNNYYGQQSGNSGSQYGTGFYNNRGSGYGYSSSDQNLYTQQNSRNDRNPEQIYHGYRNQSDYYGNQGTGSQSSYNTGNYGASVNQYRPGYSSNQDSNYYGSSNQNNQGGGYYGHNLNPSSGHYGSRVETNQQGYYGNQNYDQTSSYRDPLVNNQNTGYHSTIDSNRNIGSYDSSTNRYGHDSSYYGTTYQGSSTDQYGNRQRQPTIYQRPTNQYDSAYGYQQNQYGMDHRQNQGHTSPQYNWNQRPDRTHNQNTFGTIRPQTQQQNWPSQRPTGVGTLETYPNQRGTLETYPNQRGTLETYPNQKGTQNVWVESNQNPLEEETPISHPQRPNRYNPGGTQNVWFQPNQQEETTLRNYNRWIGRNEETTMPNYHQVVNINHMRKTTRIPYRNPYEPFFGTTARSNDFDDTFGPNHSNKYVRSTTPKVLEKHWPPPFPSTDVNADYVFEYEDNEDVSLEAENSVKDNSCGKSYFRCSTDKCIPKNQVCNSVKDCPNGQDELKCLEYVSQFSFKKNHKLAILEKERWDNVSIATCALLCVQAQKLKCRSFNYRKIDKTCLLTNTNEGLTGGLIQYQPFDYYELTSEQINCSSMYVCSNKKCISRDKICDGQDDCGDRMDEKGCNPQDFGYSLRLVDSRNRHEGHLQVTAFGKTGYICDDNFGLRDADVACKELGFALGAVEVKKNSFYGKNISDEKIFYMMDDVTCMGNETKLMDCDFSGWGVHNCLGQEKIGIVCKTPQERCPDDYWQCDTRQECLPLTFVCDGLLDCTDGSDEGSQHCDAPTQIRLVNGTNRQEGRLEIRHHGIWGTVCDDDFNEDAAKVVCKQLGFRGSAFVRKDGYFGAGTGPIWLDQVFCTGNETSVESCTHWNWGEHNCEHSEDVGVVCSTSYEYERHSMVPVHHIPDEYPERCGFRKDNIFSQNDNIHARVIKGSIAPKGDYPWQAAIRVKGKTTDAHWCGAVIIDKKFVLTAAHCLIGYSKGAYIIIAGDYNVDEDEGTEQEAYIEDFYIHEKFREGHKMNNDIALVKLKGRGFSFNEDVQPICLPDPGTSYETDQNCTISGFGSIQSGKSAFSHDLRAGWIPLQKREICTMPHVYGDALTDGMICAGSLDEGIDSCDGDSGGPLACLNQGVFTLYGITSWGQHCGYANKPGVYVKVAHYRKWIDDNFYKHSSK